VQHEETTNVQKQDDQKRARALAILVLMKQRIGI